MMTSKNEILITSLEQERNNLDFLCEENNFLELKGKIKERFDKIEKDYAEISKLTSPIVENEYFWGLIKSTNVEESLSRLLNTIQTLATHTLNAFKTNGENLTDILELMKVLASIENDLYKQLEISDCSKEAIANLLHDFCSQYNIDNQAIEELFEQSFHRTVTLKARIKNLREEIINHISSQIENVNKCLTEKEDNLKSSVNQVKEDFNREIKSGINDLRTEVVNHISSQIENVNKNITEIENNLKSFVNHSNTDLNNKLDSNVKRLENLIIDTLESSKRENETLKYEANILSQKVLKLQGHLKWYSVISVVATTIAIIGLII